MRTRFNLKLLERLCKDVHKSFNDERSDYKFYAKYKNVETAISYALRMAGSVVTIGKPIIEVGADSGLSAIAMAIGAHEKMPVYTCDVRKESIDLLNKRLKRLGIENVIPIHGTVENLIDASGSRVGFAYVDGCHSVEACTHDLEVIAKRCDPEITIGIDDFVNPAFKDSTGNGVERAVSTFLFNHPEFAGLSPQNGYFLMRRFKAFKGGGDL